MAFAAIAFTIPQYEDYPNYWLKAYEQGTTTPKVMATDPSGSPTVAKIELNSAGFPVTAGSALVIPYIDGAYDLWAFPTEADADANDTTNALQFADNVTGVSSFAAGDNTKNELTTAAMAANANYSLGDVVQTAEFSTGNGGGGIYDVVTVGSTIYIDLPDAKSVIVSTVDSAICFVLRKPDITASQFGSIQAAIDYSIDNNYESIFIDRLFDTTGTTLLIDKGLIYTEGANAFARKRITFIGIGNGEIRKTDTGFMFSATSGRNGDIAFDNITFSGNVDVAFPTVVSALDCFDCDKLIRISTTNCTFRNFDHVWYQIGTVSSPMQSVKSVNDTYTKNNIILHFNNSWDIVFNGGLMEDGNKFLTSLDVNSTTRNLIVNNGCTVEGMIETAIELNCVNYGTKVVNTYFEANQNHIQMNRFNHGVSVSDNTFLGRGNVGAGDLIRCIDVAVGDQALTVSGNASTETTANTTLLYIDETSAFNVAGRNLIGHNDVLGSAVLTNAPNRYIDLVDIASGFQNRWATFTPTLVWSGATPTGVSVAAWYKKIGTTVFIKARISATDGNNANGMTMTLPVVPKFDNKIIYIPVYQAIGAGVSSRFIYIRDDNVNNDLTWLFMGTAAAGSTYDTRFEISYEAE